LPKKGLSECHSFAKREKIFIDNQKGKTHQKEEFVFAGGLSFWPKQEEGEEKKFHARGKKSGKEKKCVPLL